MDTLLVETRYEHIALDTRGTPIIAGTTMKVKELIAERLAWGWSPEELHINHSYLTLGQIFSALAYYADHQNEIDQSIENDLVFVNNLRQSNPPSPLVSRLKKQSRI